MKIFYYTVTNCTSRDRGTLFEIFNFNIRLFPFFATFEINEAINSLWQAC